MQQINDIPEGRFLAYDIETAAPMPIPEGTDPFKMAISPVYSEIKMIGYQVGINGEPRIVESVEEADQLREMLRDPNIIKVGYNNVNFDDIVLGREPWKFYVEPRNRFDMYLAVKTVAPELKSYGLKFVNWRYLGDWHEPERKLWGWLKRHRKSDRMYAAPYELLANYCKHDVTQTINVFRLLWHIVQEPKHWKVYQGLEMAMAEPLHEMILQGGEYIDIVSSEKKIVDSEGQKEFWRSHCEKKTNGEVKNPASNQQQDRYRRKHGLKLLDRSEKGNPILPKWDLVQDIRKDENAPRFRRTLRNCQQNSSNYSPTGTFNRTAMEGVADAIKYDLERLENDKEYILNVTRYEVLKYTKSIGYIRSFVNAARFEQRRRNGDYSPRKDSILCASHPRSGFSQRRDRFRSNTSKSNSSHLEKIDKAYYLSGAKTRRFLSSSAFGINFQNQNKESKQIHIVPPGWLGVWIDSTQIENVVHIWKSGDEHRRQAYEEDEDWNEYVWLCNQIRGKEETREKLDQIESPVNSNWSIYKQFKTVKLALNFGMGEDKFAKTTGLSKRDAHKIFEQVHRACPAIRQLQNIVRSELQRDGCIKDSFGHIYRGNARRIYQVISFLVQGMGTGSFPKAMTIANYETLHLADSPFCPYDPYVKHPYKQVYSYGVLCGTTHDECAMRISLGLPTEDILMLVRHLIFNMTDRFSDKVGGIPLRAKIAFSITNAAAAVELDHRKENFQGELVRKYIEPGKKAYRDLVSNYTSNRSVNDKSRMGLLLV